MNGRERERDKADGDKRAALAASLQAQCPALYETILEHVAQSASSTWADVEYQTREHASVVAVVDYEIVALERADDGEPVPSATISVARCAARKGVPLELVLGRHHACHAKLADIIREELEHDRAEAGSAVRLILAMQAIHARVTTKIAIEYEHESVRASSPDQQRSERIERLLEGASLDTSGIDYDFGRLWHVCFILAGDNAAQTASAVAAMLGRQLLSVVRGRETVWAWLGGPQAPDMADVQAALLDAAAPGRMIALGEPGRGISGWRITHRQAQAALRVALVEPRALARYSDVGLIAPWLLDHGLARSFVEIYLAPLDELTDEGAVARETLRHYFRAGHQVVAAAAALSVDRSTLRKRLAVIERRLGYSLRTRQAELEVALRLERLYGAGAPRLSPLCGPDSSGWFM